MSEREPNPLRGYVVDVGDVLDLIKHRMDHHDERRKRDPVGSSRRDEQLAAHRALSQLHRLVCELPLTRAPKRRRP